MEKSKAVNTCFTIAHAESASGARNKTQETIKKRKVKSHAATLLHADFRDKAGLSVLPCPTPALLHAVFRDKVEGRFSE